MNIPFPNIQGDIPTQLAQIRSYLYQLTQELHFGAAEAANTAIPTAPASKQQTPQEKFNEIKALIIKSADIVESYTDAISKTLSGQYLAVSEFGAYTEQTQSQIQANATAIRLNYENVQRLLSQVGQSVTDVTAYIHTGLLYYGEDGVPVYGLELGQRTIREGETVFQKFARFTAEKLSFYDSTGSEVAYISDRRLRIPNAVVEKALTRGGYEDRIGTEGDITTRWVGIS